MTAPDQCCSNSESSCQGGAVSALVDSITGGTADVSMTERMPWLGTVRGRLGYIADGLLLYATGGHAYGRVEVDSSAMATEFFVPGSVLLFTLRSNRSGRPRQRDRNGII
jgi:opacity protein-like surface antigen